MRFLDKFSIKDLRTTKDGYLVCIPRVARVGVQDYHAKELGLNEDKIIKVFRPEEEVFSKDSMFSFAHRPITLNHPPEMVDSSNWKDYSIGQTGDEVIRDGEFIRVPMCIMDQKSIDSCIENNTIELSMGYSADLEFKSGDFNGIKYDAVQKNIRGNHLAIVDRARGGKDLNILNKDNREIFMKKMLLDGLTIEVSESSEEILKKYLKDQEEQVKKENAVKDDLEEQIAKLVTELSALKELLAKAIQEKEGAMKEKEEVKMSPEKLDEKIEEKMETVDQALKIFPDVSWKKKSVEDIRRSVVSHKIGDRSKNWSDHQIEASFNTLCSTDQKVLKVDSFGKGNSSQSVEKDKAYNDMVNNLRNAWRTK